MKSKQTLWGKFFQMLITWTVYFLFRPKVIYTDKSLKKRLRKLPCVFVANHTHHFDGAYGGAVLWRSRPWVLVKKSWWDKPRTGKMISWCRCIPINLEEADGAWFGTAERIVSDGGSLLIFPEGGISRDGKLGEFKPGAGLISAKTGVPVVPCAIYGTYSPVFGMRQKMLVGEPIISVCPEDMRHSKYARQLMSSARRAVEELYSRMVERCGDCGTYYPDSASAVKNDEKLFEKGNGDLTVKNGEKNDENLSEKSAKKADEITSGEIMKNPGEKSAENAEE